MTVIFIRPSHGVHARVDLLRLIPYSPSEKGEGDPKMEGREILMLLYHPQA
jgi:hypothetical protein